MRWNASRSDWVGILLVCVGMFAAMLRCDGASPPTPTTHVYECRVNGQRLFSDQPCAAEAMQRDITVQNQISAQEAAIGYRSSSPVSTKRKSAPDETGPNSKRQARCAVLLNDKRYLTSRLRAGYTNNQGERLRDRLRKVDSQYYDLRCSTAR